MRGLHPATARAAAPTPCAGVGSTEPGKLAHLVVLEGNPLDDIRATARIRPVMANGRTYGGDTLNELDPRERPLPPLWWWNAEPEGLPGAGPR